MSTKPDDEWLALWVEDELDDDRQVEVEKWVAGQSEWLKRREEARSWKALAKGVLPVSEEVPHAEFFNARIRREIEVREETVVSPVRSASSRWAWLMPATAAAGVLLGFWLGKGGPGAGDLEVKPPVASLAPVLYTPSKGVEAEYVASEDATVIVLAGVDAIPDHWEIPETAVLEKEDGLRTVSRDSE